MPNRIIKESICTSEKIAGLKDFDFRLWVGLVLMADDYGCGDARPAIIKGRAFPLRDRLTNKEIECSLKNLAAASCVNLYEVDGRPYYQFPNWSQHQQIRAKKSKYPAPDANGYQMISNDIKCPRNPIQSESNPEEESKRADSRPSFDTVEVYAANNLQVMTGGNMQEFADFKASLPEELIRHAIDEACAAGKRSWAYTRSILRRYEEAGFKTLGDVKAAEQQRTSEKSKPESPGNDVKWW